MRISILFGSLMMAAIMMTGCLPKTKFESRVFAALDYLKAADKDMRRRASDREEQKRNCRSAKEKADKAIESMREAREAYWAEKPGIHYTVKFLDATHKLDSSAYKVRSLAERCLEE